MKKVKVTLLVLLIFISVFSFNVASEEESSSSVTFSIVTNEETKIDEPIFSQKDKVMKKWYVLIFIVLSFILFTLFIVFKNKIFVYFGIVSSVFTVLLMILYFGFNGPIFDYNKALSFYEEGNYKKALSLLDDSGEKLEEECKYRLLIEGLLNDNKEDILNIFDGDMQVLIDNYIGSNDLFNEYINLDVLRQEIIKHCLYKCDELYLLENDKFEEYINNEISTKDVGDDFLLKDYSFRVIEKTYNLIYVIADECFYSTSIEDDTWKEEILNYFNDIEKDYLDKDNLILLTREDFKKYVSYIPVSEYSWWLNDISRVTRTDVNGVVHKLRYYAVGLDSKNQRGTSMIDDVQVVGGYSYSYIDNDSIWIRPVIKIDVLK